MNISHWIGQDVTWLIHTFQHVTNSAHRHAVVPEHGADLLYIYRTSLFMHMWHDWFTQVYFLSSLPIHTEWYWSSVRIFFLRIKRVQSWICVMLEWVMDSPHVGMSHGWVMMSEWVVDESWMRHHDSSCVGMSHGRVTMSEWVVDESWMSPHDSSYVGRSHGLVTMRLVPSRWNESWMSHDDPSCWNES